MGHDKNSNLLITSWFFWWLVPIQEPTKTQLIRTKDIVITQGIPKDLGTLYQGPGSKTTYQNNDIMTDIILHSIFIIMFLSDFILWRFSLSCHWSQRSFLITLLCSCFHKRTPISGQKQYWSNNYNSFFLTSYFSREGRIEI